jgi:cysteinyl-tRNA synthetase
MYVCGPTVYDRAHIGNARSAVVFDVLFRLLKNIYPRVTYVRNITDVDDKIYMKSMESGISIQELTTKTTKMYLEDMKSLKVLLPTIEPKATDHIEHIIKLIEKLIQKEHAYIANDHVYFDVYSFKKYGILSNKRLEDLIVGARVDVSENKKNGLDFVLWKPIDDKFKIGWQSPWGIGRPGWHIECSAMSLEYLGETFDIHGGGIDLVFPHHENEIAQSCAVTGQHLMAKYWIHNGHLQINGQKMSKTLGNFFTVRDLLDKYNGEVIRLALLMTHYVSPINFSIQLLEQAKSMLDRWYNCIRNFHDIKISETISKDVFESLLDDLNTPKAITCVNKLVNSVNHDNDEYKANVLIYTARKFLGVLTISPELWFNNVSDDTEKEWITKMIEERKLAKEKKDYKKADEIREKLLGQGIILEDTKNETIWKK